MDWTITDVGSTSVDTLNHTPNWLKFDVKRYTAIDIDTSKSRLGPSFHFIRLVELGLIETGSEIKDTRWKVATEKVIQFNFGEETLFEYPPFKRSVVKSKISARNGYFIMFYIDNIPAIGDENTKYDFDIKRSDQIDVSYTLDTDVIPEEELEHWYALIYPKDYTNQDMIISEPESYLDILDESNNIIFDEESVALTETVISGSSSIDTVDNNP